MSKKIKMVSVDPKWFQSASYRADSNVVDIIPPVSWDANTATGTVLDEDYLGNPIVTQRPFQSRQYSFNWIGSHKEINRILQVATRSSSRYFLLGDLTDHPIITPTMMFNSRAMVASVADNYKLPGEVYQPYLTMNNSDTWTPGSYGVKVSDYFNIDYSNGASAYTYVPGTQTVYVTLSPVSNVSRPNATINNIDFTFTIKTLGTATNSVYELELSNIEDVYEITVTNALVKIDMKHPVEVTTDGELVDTLNYVPPKISLGSNVDYDYDIPDLPSLLTPVDDYVYNRLSPYLAELSMNFQEVSYATN